MKQPFYLSQTVICAVLAFLMVIAHAIWKDALDPYARWFIGAMLALIVHGNRTDDRIASIGKAAPLLLLGLLAGGCQPVAGPTTMPTAAQLTAASTLAQDATTYELGKVSVASRPQVAGDVNAIAIAVGDMASTGTVSLADVLPFIQSQLKSSSSIAPVADMAILTVDAFLGGYQITVAGAGQGDPVLDAYLGAICTGAEKACQQYMIQTIAK